MYEVKSLSAIMPIIEIENNQVYLSLQVVHGVININFIMKRKEPIYLREFYEWKQKY